MVCSALVAPTTAMAGGLRSRPQTWARNFPVIFWLIVMSLCAVLSDCGHLSWLRSEQCFLSPVGLGGNWYILLRPQKILIQTMVQRSKMPSSTTLPTPSTLLPYSSYVDILYPPPTQTAQASAHASSSLASRQWKLATTQQ
jgi:hypothetical protein